MKLVIIDYDASNLHSVRKALVALGHRPVISNDPDEVAAADALVLPGVGAAGDAMRHLGELELVRVLRRFAEDGKPFFGVCVGMQLMFESSEEDGGIECLGLLEGRVRRLPPERKVPHMGWNSVRVRYQGPAAPLVGPVAPHGRLSPIVAFGGLMFEVIPAIDLRGGRCVRLFQGDFARETVYGHDPVEMARRWEVLGAGRLHVVDLDGARLGAPVQLPLAESMARAVRIPVELGGGLRTVADIERALAAGIGRGGPG